MSGPLRDERLRGWIAFGIALALHAAVGAALALWPGRAARSAGDGPPIVHLIFEEEEEEGSTFLVPPRASGGTLDAAPREIGVITGREEIVPVAPQAPPFPPPPLAQSSGTGQGAVSVGLSGSAAGAGKAGSIGGAGGAGAIFQVGRPARSVVYVIDRSSSMGGGLLAGAVRELHACLKRLPAQTQFQVVVYHDQAETLLPIRGLVAASAENVARAELALEQLRPEGGTNHLRALQTALSLGAEVIYFLTDADDLSDEDRREITQLNRGRSIIHTIELNVANRDHVNMPLQVLARENRGRYQAVLP